MKSLFYHGWSDQAIRPEHTVNYYNSGLATMGEDQSNLMELFMVPGWVTAAVAAVPTRSIG